VVVRVEVVIVGKCGCDPYVSALQFHRLAVPKQRICARVILRRPRGDIAWKAGLRPRFPPVGAKGFERDPDEPDADLRCQD